MMIEHTGTEHDIDNADLPGDVWFGDIALPYATDVSRCRSLKRAVGAMMSSTTD
jgi:hypothetical protein